MKIVYFAYRDWAKSIFNNIKEREKYLITYKDYEIIDYLKPDLLFFIGWSYIIPDNIVSKYKCICLHPSPLPKYRGGSPIQNQIINGETESAVSLFIMDVVNDHDGLDTGDILYQKKISLEGTLDNVFQRMIIHGSDGINFIINNFDNIDNIRKKQNNNDATFFKRRKPEDSEITIDELHNKEPLYLYNKIRSLNDPYPNAYIKCKNGKKLYIITAKHEE